MISVQFSHKNGILPMENLCFRCSIDFIRFWQLFISHSPFTIYDIYIGNLFNSFSLITTGHFNQRPYFVSFFNIYTYILKIPLKLNYGKFKTWNESSNKQNKKKSNFDVKTKSFFACGKYSIQIKMPLKPLRSCWTNRMYTHLY